MLRDVREEDLPTLFEHQWAPEAHRMAAVTPRERDAFMSHWRKILADSSGRKKAIVVGDEVVGNIVSWGDSSQRLVGYWIGPEHWGRGIATEALSEFLCEERLRPLYAHVAAHNRGSMRVLEKCGFCPVSNGRIASAAVEEYLFELKG
jgi:RimJ/RimL family protein N-acetyltransferase